MYLRNSLINLYGLIRKCLTDWPGSVYDSLLHKLHVGVFTHMYIKVTEHKLAPFYIFCHHAKLCLFEMLTVLLLGDWKSKILQHIDADQLPQHWGGTLTDPDGDPYCKSKVSTSLSLSDRRVT